MAIKYRIREETLRNGERTFYVEYKPYFLGRWEPVTEYVSGYSFWRDVKRATLEEAKAYVLQQKLKDAETEAQKKASEIVKVKYHV
jgi:hypothetical protein